MATEDEATAAALVIRQWLPALRPQAAKLIARIALDAAEDVRRRLEPGADARAPGIATNTAVESGDR